MTTPQRVSKKDTKEPDDSDDDYEDDENADEDESSFRRLAASAPGRLDAAGTSATGTANACLSLATPTVAPSHRPFRSPRQRKFFTEEEDAAILEGIERYGIKWSTIQRQDPRLKNRTQTDIRCRHRNMVKKKRA